MIVNKSQTRSVNFNFKDKIAELSGMDYTRGKIVQRMSELIYGSGRGGETEFYDISNCLDVFLRL